MTTRKAPGAWGRGRSIVLASAFVLMMMVVLVTATAAFATPKTGDGDAPGKSASAPGHTKDEVTAPTVAVEAPKADHKAEPVRKAATPRKKTAASSRPKAKTRRVKRAIASKTTTGSKQDWGPNQPVSDKYDGPCTRHDDTYRKGPGHDWHRGEGLGHIGVRPSAPPTVTPPSRPATSTPGGTRTPAGGPPVAPAEEPLLPFTEAAAAEPFLPFTGGDPGVLLLVATGCTLTGTGLRLQARRLHSRRRIQR